MPTHLRPNLCTILEKGNKPSYVPRIIGDCHSVPSRLCSIPTASHFQHKRKGSDDTPLPVHVDVPKKSKASRFLQSFFCVNSFVVGALLLFYLAPALYEHRRLSLRHVNFDATTRTTTASQHTILYDDGTLFVPQGSDSMCQYFAESSSLAYTEIKRIHYHFPSCEDEDVGERLLQHFGALLFANAAQVAYTMTCDPFVGESSPSSILTQVMMDNPRPDAPPSDYLGHAWRTQDLCKPCPSSYPANCADNLRLDLVSETILEQMRSVTDGSFLVDDAVVHVDMDNIIPHKSYERILRSAQMEQGELQTITLLPSRNDGPRLLLLEDLAEYLRATFLSASVRIRWSSNKRARQGSLTAHTLTHLIQAKKVTICGVDDGCSIAAIATTDGIGYVMSQRPWVPRFSDILINVRPWSAPMLSARMLINRREADVIRWAQEQEDDVSRASRS